MEFQDFCKLRNRMCRTIKSYDCILSSNCSTCEKCCIKDPIKAERIVNMWTKEHPIVTNADKFKEVFGKPIGSYGAPCPNGLTIYEIGTMSNLEWLRQEYKKPEEDDNGNDR